MKLSILDKIFGSKPKRMLNKYRKTIDLIDQFYKEFKDLSDIEIKNKSNEFRSRLSKGETEIDILPEAFGIVKEACRRTVGKSWMIDGRMQEWNMIPYEVQLIGAVVLAEGKIAEMSTGEGKTLVALFPAYLNALSGKGVHIVTVNDYLAKRDRDWMGYILEFLGLSVGVITSEDQDREFKKAEYGKDIVYGVNHEFGFDYLRDNMVLDIDDMVQRGLNYCLIDEVDSILIDEARTPLVISGPVSDNNDNRYFDLKPTVAELVKKQTGMLKSYIIKAEEHLNKNEEDEALLLILKVLKGAPKNRNLLILLSLPGIKTKTQKLENRLKINKKLHKATGELFYSIEEKSHSVELFEKGYELLARNYLNKDLFIIPDIPDSYKKISKMNIDAGQKEVLKSEINREHADKTDKIHIIHQLLKAYAMYERDVDYIVKDERIIIVDQSTGRLKEDSRYSDGIHQAIEAKEGVRIKEDTQTIASITYQNYFRMYEKLSGMTGTAIPEESEFFDIYKLKVSVIPTNAPVIRDDMDDRIYVTKKEKYEAVLKDLTELHKEGRPVLLGTPDVDVSQIMHMLLSKNSIPHNLLNAKNHAKEAHIIRDAGSWGAVTIATNMAGRGTDIKLGKGVREKGGLAVLGCERHDSRRIDRQLRGRAGRQGDPGSSRFYISLEDNLMRIYGSERISAMLDRSERKEDGRIELPAIKRSVKEAQKRVEMNNLSIRKNVLKYDDVMNKKRDIIYNKRRSLLIKSAVSEGTVLNEIEVMIENYVSRTVHDAASGTGNIDNLDINGLNDKLMKTLKIRIEEQDDKFISVKDITEKICDIAVNKIKNRQKIIGDHIFGHIAGISTVNIIDRYWQEHLRENDELINSIYLVSYANIDPLTEYKIKSFEMFQNMLVEIDREALEMIFNF